MKRREFIALVAGAAAWPLAARAQQAMPVIGFLSSTTATHRVAELAAFRKGLEASGYVEGQNLAIEYRWAEGRYDRLPVMADELVQRRVAVIVAIAAPAADAAKRANTEIPSVFVVGGDPVSFGLIASLSRPGGHLTGVSFLANLLVAKQIEVLHELVPSAARIGILLNPGNPNAAGDVRDAEEAARALGLELTVLNGRTADDINAAFATMSQLRVGGLVTTPDPFLLSRRDQILALTERHALPAIYPVRDFPAAGGLMSYGSSITTAYHEAGVYAGKILRGAKPADLPVQQSTKVELVINLKTAKSLGLNLPLTLLGRADEVIE
jgi:putative tryptophan/tyrosine transport system substrate-binding protein